MSRKIGITNNTQARIISGAKVLFDFRRTEEVNDTRDPTNRVSGESSYRNMARLNRLREEQRNK